MYNITTYGKLWGGAVDRIQKDLMELCSNFMSLLDKLKKINLISEAEYEALIKLKRDFTSKIK